MSKNKTIKLVVILGPTASGKSKLAIKLAKEFKGEIISVDSRQIYKGLEIGSGAVTKKERQNIPHHLIGFLNPQKTYSAEQFRKKAIAIIKRIDKDNKVPFLVGGTGFWLETVTNNLQFPKAKPNQRLRKKLSEKSNRELFKMLKKLNPQRAKLIDKNNPRRLIRAIEIALTNPHNFANQLNKEPDRFQCLFLGVKKSQEKLKTDIARRFNGWLRKGFLKEVQKLIESRISKQRFKELGLHYWFGYLYLNKKISYPEFVIKSISSIWKYAKRQMTWFKKYPQNSPVHWVENYKEAKQHVQRFLRAE